jgi:hypothetical protein
MVGGSVLNALDRERDVLAARHPGWRIWYVPHAVGGVTWCAQQKPTLNEHSPEDLEKAIAEVESEDWQTPGSRLAHDPPGKH